MGVTVASPRNHLYRTAIRLIAQAHESTVGHDAACDGGQLWQVVIVKLRWVSRPALEERIFAKCAIIPRPLQRVADAARRRDAYWDLSRLLDVKVG
jgi:hypothetical protein